MTGQRPDPEEVIREWLAGSVPDRAPASFKATVAEATSRPAGHARPWPRAGWRSLRFAGRVAAAIAILAIAGSGVYFFGNFRGTPPAAPSASASATASATSSASSATGTIGASPSPSMPALPPKVTQLPGSNWKLLSGVFPQMVAPAYAQYERTVFELGSTGFVAFVPSAGSAASSPSGDTTLPAFVTPGPGAATSWETRVYQSRDGINWTQQASLPTNTATVTAAAETGGRIVAVGTTGVWSHQTAMAWTTTDLLTWHATGLPAPDNTDSYSNALAVAGGPAGFLACGSAGSSDQFWTSSDGLSWTPLVPSGVPGFAWDDGLYGVSSGWIIRGFLSDREAAWHSADGAHWTQVWTGPAPQGLEYYALGQALPAPGGGYVSFGVAGMGPGGPARMPYDQLIWTSKDLTRWTISARVPSPGWISDYAAGPGGYVAAGVLAPGDPGVLPTGSVAVWTSKDGRTWKAIAGLESIGSSQVLSVVGDGAHIVVVCVDQAGNVQIVVGDGAS
ncbi:MAG TPA: hypothetical protein VIK06_08390 [Candidatus Limnocylindrales bacterium]|jgi:hypothetical protein